MTRTPSSISLTIESLTPLSPNLSATLHYFNPGRLSCSIWRLWRTSPGGGGEAFGVTVCRPEWLAKKCETEGYFPGFHHLVVRFEDYDVNQPATIWPVTRERTNSVPVAVEPITTTTQDSSAWQSTASAIGPSR
jgi:hypothetical protein